MKHHQPTGIVTVTLSNPHILLLTAVLLLTASCALRTAGGKQDDQREAAFAKVKPVLERNCVHCHADIRLPGMPSLTDTEALSGLIGDRNLIVPGKPEQSRFYLVATYPDAHAGAMPPTGHAMTPEESVILREWIQGGAALPSEVIRLHAKGRSPRSR